MHGLNYANLTVTPETVTDPEGNPVHGVRVTASAPMATTFMRLGLLIGCGTGCESINVAATAVAAPGGTFDLAMDLDDTNSMHGAKLAAAKSSAHTLVDAAGGSGANVCKGLKKTREKLFESGVSRSKAGKFIVILTDADNNYNETKAGSFVSAACKPSGVR